MEQNLKSHKLSKQGFGKLLRKKFLDHMKNEWGAYQPIRDYLYSFSNGNKVVTFYSSLNHGRWWYGVGKNYWDNWDKNSYIVLLMRDSKICEYFMLNPKDSKTLLSKIKEDQQGKKHIVIYLPSIGKRYLQQWQEYQLEGKIVKLDNLDIEGSINNIKKNTVKRKVISKDDPLESALNYLKTLSPQEKVKFLNQLKATLKE